MQIKVIRPWLAVPTAWHQRLLHEIKLSWQFIAGDVSSAVVPALLFLAAAWSSHQLTLGRLLAVLAQGVLYFWLYAYTFCLSNQLTGLEEDRLNKPHRPLARGIVSPRGTQRRWLISMAAFTCVGWLFGVLPWALLWQLIIVLHNFGGWGQRWYFKNFSMSLGIVAQLAAAWQIVMPITPIAWRWISVFAGVIFILVSLQDLRDIAGDRANGRRTFPMVFGEQATRYLLGVCFGLLPLVVHFWLMLPAGATLPVWLCDLGLAIVSWTIAWRILMYRTPRADHYTYLLFTYWYCLAVLSSVIVL